MPCFSKCSSRSLLFLKVYCTYSSVFPGSSGSGWSPPPERPGSAIMRSTITATSPMMKGSFLFLIGTSLPVGFYCLVKAELVGSACEVGFPSLKGIVLPAAYRAYLVSSNLFEIVFFANRASVFSFEKESF